jgi:thioredoxin 1
MKSKILIAGILLVALGGLYLMARSKPSDIPAVDNHERLITLTDKNFKEQTKNKLILVDFWAEWCAPCRMMAPILNDVAGELTGNSYVGKVNVDDYRALAQEYRISNIPTMILFKDGQEVARIVGVKNKEYLIQQIEKVK